MDYGEEFILATEFLFHVCRLLTCLAHEETDFKRKKLLIKIVSNLRDIETIINRN